MSPNAWSLLKALMDRPRPESSPLDEKTQGLPIRNGPSEQHRGNTWNPGGFERILASSSFDHSGDFVYKKSAWEGSTDKCKLSGIFSA